jgi:hypothetical protein
MSLLRGLAVYRPIDRPLRGTNDFENPVSDFAKLVEKNLSHADGDGWTIVSPSTQRRLWRPRRASSGFPRIPLEPKFTNDFDSKGAESDLPARPNADLRGNDLEKKINERSRRQEPINRLLEAIDPPGRRQSANSHLAVFPI